VAEVRAFVAEQCDRWELLEAQDDLVLMASEIVTNAILHARSGFEVSMSLFIQEILLEVRETGSKIPTAPMGLGRASVLGEDRGGESGRGLVLVAELAGRWGTTELAKDAGKIVWVSYPRA
jgi:anti-sigma regulatory factor (Ser/Thr protein kinase)